MHLMVTGMPVVPSVTVRVLVLPVPSNTLQCECVSSLVLPPVKSSAPAGPAANSSNAAGNAAVSRRANGFLAPPPRIRVARASAAPASRTRSAAVSLDSLASFTAKGGPPARPERTGLYQRNSASRNGRRPRICAGRPAHGEVSTPPPRIRGRTRENRARSGCASRPHRWILWLRSWQRAARLRCRRGRDYTSGTRRAGTAAGRGRSPAPAARKGCRPVRPPRSERRGFRRCQFRKPREFCVGRAGTASKRRGSAPPLMETGRRGETLRSKSRGLCRSCNRPATGGDPPPSRPHRASYFSLPPDDGRASAAAG